jgi:hypothetical protein
MTRCAGYKRGMKITITFNEDEQELANIATNALEVHCSLFQFQQRMRTLEKYEGKDLHGLRELFGELFGRYVE